MLLFVEPVTNSTGECINKSAAFAFSLCFESPVRPGWRKMSSRSPESGSDSGMLSEGGVVFGSNSGGPLMMAVSRSALDGGAEVLFGFLSTTMDVYRCITSCRMSLVSSDLAE